MTMSKVLLKTKPRSFSSVGETHAAIYATVQRIPSGKVATYGQVAEQAGFPRRARLVGRLLWQLDETSDVPWHRVINARGEISYSPSRNGGDVLQRQRLEAEGVVFSASGTIDLGRYQ
ncbi:MAG: MGMT family protein, partial [Rickettsiales bacterium]|nr:MGMT family protein [Rickettsiales bacterium]